MSGTSVDGLDIALCNITGEGHHTKVKVIDFETIFYQPDFKEEIKSIFSRKEIDFEKLCLLNPWVALHQAEMINNFLRKRNIAKEAVLFAILANECIAGGTTRFSNELKGIPSVTMGKISFPW